MSKTVTYGVKGMMEWHALLNAGKCLVHVDFTGGALTGYGVTPAEYTTSDPIMQHIIEHSTYFQQGKIITLRVIRDEQEAHREERPVAGGNGAEENALHRISVSCIDDAKDYLVENLGISPAALRGKKSIVEQARQNGIEFEGI